MCSSDLVKLFRVSMLAVVVLVVSCLFRHRRATTEDAYAIAKPALVPWFLWVFVALVIVNSVGGVPTVVQTGLNDASRMCMIVAIAALGVKTSFSDLARAGWRPFALLLVETLWMAGFVLTAILLRS